MSRDGIKDLRPSFNRFRTSENRVWLQEPAQTLYTVPLLVTCPHDCAGVNKDEIILWVFHLPSRRWQCKGVSTFQKTIFPLRSSKKRHNSCATLGVCPINRRSWPGEPSEFSHTVHHRLFRTFLGLLRSEGLEGLKPGETTLGNPCWSHVWLRFHVGISTSSPRWSEPWALRWSPWVKSCPSPDLEAIQKVGIWEDTSLGGSNERKAESHFFGQWFWLSRQRCVCSFMSLRDIAVLITKSL